MSEDAKGPQEENPAPAGFPDESWIKGLLEKSCWNIQDLSDQQLLQLLTATGSLQQALFEKARWINLLVVLELQLIKGGNFYGFICES
jgi:hypothetical protein